MEINISKLYREKKDEAYKVMEQIRELKSKLDANKLTHNAYVNTEVKIDSLEKLYVSLMSEADGISQVREMFMDAENFDYV